MTENNWELLARVNTDRARRNFFPPLPQFLSLQPENYVYLSRSMNPSWVQCVMSGVPIPKSITDSVVSSADSRSMQALVPLVYAELRALAGKYLHGERAHTLQPTALVHEAFLKMVGGDSGWSDKDHFKAVAAIAMRQVLVDRARARTAAKRGGKDLRECCGMSIEGFADGSAPGHTTEMQIEELDELLTLLAASSARMARIAELRLFGGMETDQIARVSGHSLKTVQRDWKLARAWLAGKIKERQGG